MENLKIVNVSLNCEINRKINFLFLTVLFPEITKKKNFSAMILKQPEAATFLIFNNGKIVTTGAKSVQSASDAIEGLINTINEKLNENINLLKKEVVNIVATSQMRDPIDLTGG